ncbi:hypothetical protein [Actinomadura harenae]|uniref:Uncharacterized protein n=1 Tax=Actinomadura harenae TaxID=2483351 RepID=A0A3M2LPP6_9ACTN|nr:hypothetical protein [Actinomadura harenae]RMI38055.1 hypothetical protein EBO15_34050 [Actinomadura harenae]
MNIGDGFPLGRLARAFTTATTHEDQATRQSAERRVQAWTRVLEGKTDGTLTIGSRTPVAGLPAWVTLEVVRGGFATGRPLAGGPLLPHEAAVAPDRAAGFAHYLTDAGLAELNAMLDAADYEITVPEEAALLTVAWLLREGDRAGAFDVLDAIAPFADSLRFVPARRPGRPARDPEHVFRTSVGEARSSLLMRRTPPAIDAMQEALSVWNPFADRLLAHWLTTVVDGRVAASFPEDWRVRATELLAEYRVLAARHRLCSKPRRPKENSTILRTAMKDVVRGSALKRGLLQHAVDSMVARRGRPGSPEHAALRERQAAEAARPTHRALAAIAADRLAGLPQDDGLPDTAAFVHPVTEDEHARTRRSGVQGQADGRGDEAESSKNAPQREGERTSTATGPQRTDATPTGWSAVPDAASAGRLTAPDAVSAGRLAGPDAAAAGRPVGPDAAAAGRLVGSDGVPVGTAMPDVVVRAISQALSAPIGTLVDRRIVPSAEVLAGLAQQLVASTVAADYGDRALAALRSAAYRAFRGRRSLLLVNLESQVRFEELPWVHAVASRRGSGGDAARTAARATLTRLGGLTLGAFPGTIIPNRLVTEFAALAGQAELDAPFVEELAADIFMSTFSPKFVWAAEIAAELLDGSVYARYYGIDTAQLWTLRAIAESASRPTAGAWKSHAGLTSDPEWDAARKFAALCSSRAGARWGPGTSAKGRVIEQSQILTTHNLAVLAGPAGVTPEPGWPELARRAFAVMCARLVTAHRSPLPLRAVKDAAYAWRQALFFVSMADDAEPHVFAAWARDETERAFGPVATRTAPPTVGLDRVLAGLDHVLDGGGLDGDEAYPRRFLGWSGHWILGR